MVISKGGTISLMAVGRPGLFEWTVLYYAIPEKTLPFHEDLLLLIMRFGFFFCKIEADDCRKEVL